MNRIKVVTIVGANGTMGTNVSGIFALFGNAKVYMVCRDKLKAENAKELVSKRICEEKIIKNLVPVDFSELDKCVSESNLVFESVTEDILVKKVTVEKIARFLRPDAVICSGTSGLSITALAEYLPEELRGRLMGVHMFNPPYSLSLCEVIRTKYTDPILMDEICIYLKEVMQRTVVVVKDTPAFLANRIGFQFINEAMQIAETYKEKGGVDYVDSIMGPFTGRAMAPLATADFVGLDVHKTIVDNIYKNTNDYARETFVLPDFVQELIDKGMLGRKVRAGLYKMEKMDDGNKKLMTYDIGLGKYRPKREYELPFAKKMNELIGDGDYRGAVSVLINDSSEEATLCLQMMLKYIVYSLITVNEAGLDIHAADAAMATDLIGARRWL